MLRAMTQPDRQFRRSAMVARAGRALAMPALRGAVPGWRVERRALACALLLVAASAGLSGAAAAAPRCQTVATVFRCSYDDGAGLRANGLDLTNLRRTGRSARWVRKHCAPVDVWPPGCDWGAKVGGMLAGRSGGRRGPAARGSAARADKAAKRARRHRARGPTPAPRRALDAPTSRGSATGDAGAGDGPYAEHIAAAAARYSLPAGLIRAVIEVESRGNPNAVSSAGAQGLMQLMPATGRAMGVQDPWDPAQNIDGGSRFLRVLANRFDGDLVKVIAAYHAGSMRVLRKGATPFASTDGYVRRVLQIYYGLRDATRGG
jgi:hypothetical protein